MSDAYRWRPELEDWLERADALTEGPPPDVVIVDEVHQWPPMLSPDSLAAVSHMLNDDLRAIFGRLAVAVTEAYRTLEPHLGPLLRLLDHWPSACPSCLGPLPKRGRCRRCVARR